MVALIQAMISKYRELIISGELSNDTQLLYKSKISELQAKLRNEVNHD